MHANQTYEGTLQNTMEPIGIVVDWLKTNSGKIILLIVVALLAAVIDKALTRIVSKVLDRSQVPNASIFINILARGGVDVGCGHCAAAGVRH